MTEKDRRENNYASELLLKLFQDTVAKQEVSNQHLANLAAEQKKTADAMARIADEFKDGFPKRIVDNLTKNITLRILAILGTLGALFVLAEKIWG